MNKVRFFRLFFVLVMTAMMAFVTVGCSEDDDDAAAVRDYGGSDPVGDYVVVQIDSENSKVRRINYTNPEDTGWLDYAPETGTQYSSGFTIINRVTLDSGGFVLFAEFPGAACVYQVFDSTGDAEGNPVYVVARESVDASSYYDRAFNWMKFTIAGTASNSDMECGFAAFDQSSTGGVMYGAGYSKRSDFMDYTVFARNGDANTYGVSDNSQQGDIEVDEFTYDAESVANIMWTGTVGDRDDAITLTGTASGTVILDFGPDNPGGGMGLAFPQTSDGEFDTSYAGTYFAMVYEYDNDSGETGVNPMKIVVTAAGAVQAFVYEASTTSTDPAERVFNSSLTAIKDFAGGPNSEPIRDTFATVSGNSAAESDTVQDAHNCYGAFLAQSGGSVVNLLFDAQGRFMAFTMFDDNTTSYVIRFGFCIKDENYANP